MKRVLTALALIPGVTYVVLWGPQWLLLAVVAVVALLCFREYSGIVAGHGIDRPGPLGYAAGLLVLLVPERELLLVTMLALIAMIFAFRANDLARGLPRAAALLLGVIYVFATLRFGVALRAASPWWLFFALGLSWAGDTAAYYVGMAVGRHKMAPRLSPAKTWEGAAGSLAGSLLFGPALLAWQLPSVPFWHAAIISAAGNIAGQFGDLAESALKRGAQLKDSGTLLPGHGGWLDRLDSTLFTLPVVYLLLSVL